MVSAFANFLDIYFLHTTVASGTSEPAHFHREMHTSASLSHIEGWKEKEGWNTKLNGSQELKGCMNDDAKHYA